MNTENQEVKQIEISMETAKANIESMEALLRLTKNKDFKKLVEVGYFEKEASRTVLMLADPSTDVIIAGQPSIKEGLEKQIIAIGQLRQYFVRIMQKGRMSERSLVNDQETHAELLKEEV